MKQEMSGFQRERSRPRCEYADTLSSASRKRLRTGVIYHRGISKLALVSLALMLVFHFAQAQDTGGGVPNPAPTDAVKESGQKLTVKGRAPTNQGQGPARYAALLDAYGQLLRHGLHNGLFAGSWGAEDEGFRFHLVDADHPAHDVVSFLSRSKVLKDQDLKNEKVLTLESPELGTLASAQPFLRAMVTQDVDGDGLSDVVAVGYDGAVYILKSPNSGESKVAARSESFGLIELVTGPDYERVRAVLPQDVGSIEPVGSGQVRVLLELEILEMVNGRLLGRTLEHREVMLSLEHQQEQIRFSISDPPDFTRLFEGDMEIRGTAISEKLLGNVMIAHNGTVAWESPEGIGIRALNFNLARSLVPGWNNFRITARDTEGYSQLREIWVEWMGNAPRVRGGAQGKRAVILSLDDKLKDNRWQSALAEAGFPEPMVTILEGDEASASNLLAAIREGLGADELLLYCESYTQPGTLIGGKNLRFEDREVEPSELAQALEAGGYEKTVGVFHSEVPRAMREQYEAAGLWRDTVSFLERVGGAGRLMVGNIEDSDVGTRTQRKRSRERLLDALRAPVGSDLERLLDTKQPQNTVFRGWMFGQPVIGPQ
jgi:hypothetical protein